MIYNSDASGWTDYIEREKKNGLHTDDIVIAYVKDTDMFPTMGEDTQNSLISAKVIVVIASPGFVDCIQHDETRQCMIQDPTNAILFLCGLTVKDLEVSRVAQRFHQFDVWTKITHNEPLELFKRIAANVANLASKPTPSCALKAKQAATNKCVTCNGVSGDTTAASWVDPKWAFDVTPSRIRSEVSCHSVFSCLFLTLCLPPSSLCLPLSSLCLSLSPCCSLTLSRSLFLCVSSFSPLSVCLSSHLRMQ